jgi:hypothetical protein
MHYHTLSRYRYAKFRTRRQHVEFTALAIATHCWFILNARNATVEYCAWNRILKTVVFIETLRVYLDLGRFALDTHISELNASWLQYFLQLLNFELGQLFELHV